MPLTFALDEQPAFVQRPTDLVREVFATEVALDPPEIKVAASEQGIASDTAGSLGMELVGSHEDVYTLFTLNSSSPS